MWRSRHQIMSRLARTNKVLWVEPRLTLRQTQRAMGQPGVHWLPAVEHAGAGLYVLHNPGLLPSTGPAGLGAVAGSLYRSLVRRTMRRLGMSRPILWLYLPEMVATIGQYGERLVVYHVVDEYSSYSGMPASYIPHLREMEEQLLRRAGVVVATAPALLESKSRFTSNIHLVPNAVDYEGFQRILATGWLPPAMASLPAPVIGYVGAINDKVDCDLLLAVARGRPDWTLAMVGPVDDRQSSVRARIEALRALPNVRFIGQVAVADVPLYMAACQVCLLPYVIGERTRNISALKLYEYLACGKPVVSTDIPAAAEGQGTVRVAGPGTFVSAIDEALHDSPEAAQLRRSVAAANTWDQRVEAISAILENVL